ncbi:unnamed protein product [Gongylonema pulchrum]|uniref:Ig-like domain-containing protein n=1 Tax=Gongylonema pulchrum TaxID=637853 RepID=A0A183D7Y0_9BILA|nr:unnamed protein product [Gongylonema pulchrum]
MESSEIAEFNNFMLKKPVETAARHEFTLREARFGGSLELSTRRTTESTMTVSSALQRSSHSFDITVRRVIANRGESVRVTCSATEENHFFVSLELQSMKLARYESLLICKAPNRETPQQMYTSESSELVQVSNVSMQKTFAYESSHIVWAEKRRFEILPLLCNASRETYAELYNCLESRLPLKQHAGTTIIFREIRRGDHVRMKLMATEETIFNAEVSFEKQSYEAVRTHTEQEISTEVPQLLETLESLETAIEVRETEVRRRLSEVHVESALEIAARECSPISLQTDSAEQTLIRHDAELHVDVQRTVGMAEIEKSAIAVEREKLLCAGVDVTLRHEEEEYEEQREEKSEKRLVLFHCCKFVNLKMEFQIHGV